MRKLSSGWDKATRLAAVLLAAGCATPQYAVRQAPVPQETASALEIERTISAEQARDFQKQGARLIGPAERIAGFDVQRIVDRLSRVTERPGLDYRAYVYKGKDPNAAALADGRIYLSTGMLTYLGARGSREDEPLDSPSARSGRMPSEVEAELAFILGHELAHTVAQHLVKRYDALARQQLLLALLAAGASAATSGASASAQQAGQIALDAASVLQSVHNSGFSQEQELEADQFGVRYVVKAGYAPRAGFEMLKDFERFDSPTPFLRTHPYIALRRAYLERYLQDSGLLGQETAVTPAVPRLAPASPAQSRLRELRTVQQLYPRGSVSWRNLQRQIDALDK